MKKEFIDEITSRLIPYMKDDCLESVKMQLEIVCSNYDIKKLETSLTVYEENKNAEILKRFLMAKIAAGRSRRTIEYYKNTMLTFFAKVGKNYDEITADDIRLYLAIRVNRDGVQKSTANNERRNVSAFYTWLQKEEILLKNPMGRVDMIKTTKKKKKAFSKMEVELLRDHCKTLKEKALVETLLSTWCRVTEAAEIKLINIDGNKIVVHGKGDKIREVYLTAKAQLAIQKYLEERNDNNPYLFPRAKYAGDVTKMCKGVARKLQAEWYKNASLVDETQHQDAGSIESQIRNLGNRAKVANTHPHRFRRTGATMALKNGMPLITVSKLLGHADIGVTQVYLDITDAELEEAHDKYVQ